MPKSAKVVAEDIREFMRKQSLDVWTAKWEKFYPVADRDRIKEPFQVALAQELAKLSFLISFGSAVVLVARDFDFADKAFKP